jgi:hypothetical protein
MSTAQLKFTDTTPGGSFAINPPPQFCRFTDPRVKGLANGSPGLGRYYNEAIEENSQLINLRFGVPKFNSLTTFFGGFYNSGAGQLARTGRSTDAFYAIGKAAGFVVSIMSWKLLFVHALGYASNFVLQKPSSKFYYLKPTMPLYWNAVQTIVNQIAVNMGIVPRLGGNDVMTTIGNNYQFDSSGQAKLHALLPDIINTSGSIDVFSMANKAQRLARQFAKLQEAQLSETDFTLSSAIQSIFTTKISDTPVDYATYLKKWVSGTAQAQLASSTASGAEVGTEQLDSSASANSGFFDFLKAELDDGGAFATFRVNYTGAVGESFSNSVGESDIAQKMNSTSASAREMKFNFANGNLMGGAAGALLQTVSGAITDVVSGALDGLHLSGLAALGGSAFVDIPKHWQSSMASLPHSTYTINLNSPYGNPVSRLINLWVPVAMLLAGTLPLSTGTQSYTSPFICELYDQGRCQTRLGMIESLSITRGTGNTGFNNRNEALGLEVSFSIVDMSSVLHMPIHAGFGMTAATALGNAGGVLGGVSGAVLGSGAGVVGAAVVGGAGATAGTAIGFATGTAIDTASAAVDTFANIFDDDNSFTDYMAVLGSMGLEDQIYSWKKFKLKATMQAAQWKSWTSAAHFASFMGDTSVARVASAIFKGTAR